MVTVWWSAAWLIHYSFLNPNHYIWEACSANRWDAPKTAMPASSIGQHVWWSLSHVRLFGTPWRVPFCPWNSLGKNTRLGCHWSTGGIQLFSMTMPNYTSHNQRFRSWKNWDMKFCLILHIHLNSCQPTITSSSISTTFCKENVSTTRRQRVLSKSSSNPEAWSFKLQE